MPSPLLPIMTPHIPLAGGGAFTHYAVVNGTQRDIAVFDVSDPGGATISLADSILTIGTRSNGVSGYGPDGLVLMADYDADAVRCIDCADPTNISNVGNVISGTQLNRIIGITVDDDGSHAFAVGETDFGIVNITNPASPSVSGFVAIGGVPNRGIAYSATHDYVWGSTSNGIVCINVSNRASPVLDATFDNAAGTANIGGCENFYYDEANDELWCLDGAGKQLIIFDVSTPSAPVEVNYYSDPSQLWAEGTCFAYDTVNQWVWIGDTATDTVIGINFTNRASVSVSGDRTITNASLLNGPNDLTHDPTAEVLLVTCQAGNGVAAIDTSVPASAAIIDSISDATNATFATSGFAWADV